MRTALLLVLLAGVAQGQTQAQLEAEWHRQRENRNPLVITSFDTYVIGFEDRVMRYIVGRDTVYGRGLNEAIGVLGSAALVSAWDAYVRECWADSTAYIRHVPAGGWPCLYWSYGTGRGGRCSTVGHFDETAYLHREPTFPGFIEYLRKR